jgi:hypothetical protein
MIGRVRAMSYVSACGAVVVCVLAGVSCGQQDTGGGGAAGTAGTDSTSAGASGEGPGLDVSGGGGGGGDGAVAPSAGGVDAAVGGTPNRSGDAGAGGVDANLPDLCKEVVDCDDDDACTRDGCDAVAGCVHVNPDLDCRGWTGSKCAAAAIEARGSGEQVTCVPPTTFPIGAAICADQVCNGAPGCELKYTIEDGVVTTTDAGYDFEGRLVSLLGTVAGKYGDLQCQFEVGLSEPEPFLVSYSLSRAGCSQVVKVGASAQAAWTGVAIRASSPQCGIVVSLLRSLLTPAQLNGYLKEPLETLTCAACADGCPDGIACR